MENVSETLPTSAFFSITVSNTLPTTRILTTNLKLKEKLLKGHYNTSRYSRCLMLLFQIEKY